MDWALHMRGILSQLGEDVSIVRGTGTGTTVNGIFSKPYQQIDLGIGSVTGSNPQFAYMTADYTAAIDDVLTRLGVTYKIKVKQPDDPSGVTVVELKKSP